MSSTDEIVNNEQAPVQTDAQEENEQVLQQVEIEVCLPDGRSLNIGLIATNETLGSIKQTLFEFQETAFLTNFNLKLRECINSDGYVLPTDADYSEALELSQYLHASVKKCIVDLVYDDYDVKKARVHVKRTREAILSPPAASFSQVNKETAEEEEKPEKPKDSLPQTKEKISSVLPKVESLLAPVDLGVFYDEVVLRSGKAVDGSSSKILSDVIKSVSLSGWNPPPPARRMQGDLLYVEVATAAEGTFHITATPRGYYVNKSNRNHFDPAPASAGHAHFSHDLFSTLLGVSSALRTAWYTLTNMPAQKAQFIEDVGAMDSVASAYAQGKGDVTSLVMQWNTAPNSAFPGSHLSTHTYDLSRTQEDASSLHGVEELGAPREWNEEIQALRGMAPAEMNEKAMKAKMEFKIVAEFTDACKAAVLAISEGHIAPIAYNEPLEAHPSSIYVYNGIFFSKAEDAKDSFRICNGDAAFKKCTGRDLQNLKLIQALGVDGVCTVLVTLVDFKGDRYIAQSIIPGIFAQGDNAATLMYGMLEKDKPISVKNSTFKLMEEIRKAFFLPVRNISRKPFAHLVDEEKPKETAVSSEQLDTLNRLLGGADGEESVSIRVDDTDSLVAADAENTPHIGPIEGKVLRGSDGKMYVLEMMRLTPMDANYVRGEKGSQKIASEALEQTDKDMGVAYVLRSELISIFLQRQIALKRQELVAEATAVEKKYRKPAGEKKEGETADEAVSAEDALLPEMDEETQQKIQADFAARFADITAEAHKFEVNPNVFLENFTADVDQEVVAKDEAVARELAVFLFDLVLPMITKQVREGDLITRDSDSLVAVLHKTGVNMRYLGQLARLAKAEEDGDKALLAQNKQRVQAMPQYWLELLVIEVIARASKHVLNCLYKESTSIAAAPAETIAAFLTHLFTAIYKPEATSTEGETASTAATTTTNNNKQTSTVAEAAAGGTKKNKKKKAVAAAIAAVEQSNCFNASAKGVATQETALSTLVQTIASRFCLKVSFTEVDQPAAPVPEASAEGAAPATTDAKSAAEAAPATTETAAAPSTSDINLTFLRSRISPATLLRRICQACGLRITTRSYDFGTGFSAEDIAGVVPKVKSCESDSLMPEFGEMVATSANVMNQGNFPLAYDIAQEAFNFISQITGMSHQLAAIASDQVATVLLAAGDLDAALQVSVRRLAIAVHLHGLDGTDTLQQHVQLAQLYRDMQLTGPAIQHLLTAKYLQELSGGPRHVELASLYLRLGALYEEVNDLEASMRCLHLARELNNDMLKGAVYTSAIAEFYHRRGGIEQALMMQKQVHDMLKELLPETDERLVEAKASMDVYQEQFTKAVEAMRKEYLKQQVEEAKRVRALAAAGNNTNGVAAANAALEQLSVAEKEGEAPAKKKRHAHKKRGAAKK